MATGAGRAPFACVKSGGRPASSGINWWPLCSRFKINERSSVTSFGGVSDELNNCFLPVALLSVPSSSLRAVASPSQVSSIRSDPIRSDPVRSGPAPARPGRVSAGPIPADPIQYHASCDPICQSARAERTARGRQSGAGRAVTNRLARYRGARQAGPRGSNQVA